jgi:hypothetical protein
MKILGNAAYIPHEEFVKKVKEACVLLRDKAGVRYTVIYNNVNLIVANSRSGADVSKSNIDIARATFNSSVTWLASVLIHEGVHIEQYKAGKDYSGQAAEQACNVVQLDVLRLIGAPQSEITYMLAQDGMHFDLNGDGVYDWKDYELRNY